MAPKRQLQTTPESAHHIGLFWSPLKADQVDDDVVGQATSEASVRLAKRVPQCGPAHRPSQRALIGARPQNARGAHDEEASQRM